MGLPIDWLANRTRARSACAAASARLLGLAFDEAPTSFVLGVVAAIGAAIALRIFGSGYLLGTDPYWSYPGGDPAVTLTGWRYFSQHPWQFPVGTAFATNTPAGANLVFFDSIPLVAIAGKLLVPLLGTRWHPYGIWHCLIYVLQGVFGALLARRLGLRGVVGGVAAAVLCLTSAVFLLRSYQESLNAQFVILWALFEYSRSAPGEKRGASVAGWAACLCCALLITPYLFAMIVPIAVSAHVRLALADRRAALISAVASTLSIALSWFVVGYELHEPNEDEARALGLSSMNLLSLVVPFYSRLVAHCPPSSAQEMTGYQWDAHNFLGMGGLLLVAIAIALCSRQLRVMVRRNELLCVALLLLALYSPGPRWYVGHHEILDLHLSDTLRRELAMFRATGRFFWPVGYALVLGSALVIARHFGRRGTAVVAFAAGLQLYDSTASWRVACGAVAHPARRYADWVMWSAAVAPYTRVEQYPSYHCWGAVTPREELRASQQEIEFIAASRGMTTNHAVTGRVISDCTPGLADVEKLVRYGLAPQTLYLFFRGGVGSADAVARLGSDVCIELDDAWACSSPAPALGLVRRAGNDRAR